MNFHLIIKLISLSILSIDAISCPSPAFMISSIYLVSDTSTLVTGPDVTGQVNAILASGGAWTAIIPGATWIWDAPTPTIPSTCQTVIYTKLFNIPGFPISAFLDVAADNYYWVNINGNTNFCDSPSTSTFTSSSQVRCNIQRYLFPGQNSVIFTVKNQADPGAVPPGNPAGLLYSISIQVNLS